MKTLRKRIKSAARLAEQVGVILFHAKKLKPQSSGRPRIPVLMYHKVIKRPLWEHNLNYFVTEKHFRLQMEFLAQNGYNALSVEQYTDCLLTGNKWPDKSVLLTFDDGYAGVAQLAYPILREFGFHAVAFLSCNFIGSKSLFPYDGRLGADAGKIYPELLPLTWDEIYEIQDMVAIGSHTMSHVLLAPLSEEKIRYEIFESKQFLEDKLGREITSFSYPGGLARHGSFNELTRRVLVESGYKVAFNSEIGGNYPGSDAYLQKRINVEDRDSDSLLGSKLVGTYDWMRAAQGLFHVVYGGMPRHR